MISKDQIHDAHLRRVLAPVLGRPSDSLIDDVDAAAATV
jgi:hypothetical protein